MSVPGVLNDEPQPYLAGLLTFWICAKRWKADVLAVSQPFGCDTKGTVKLRRVSFKWVSQGTFANGSKSGIVARGTSQTPTSTVREGILLTVALARNLSFSETPRLVEAEWPLGPP